MASLIVPDTARTQKLYSHYFYPGRDSRDADAVVRNTGDRARDVSGMEMVAGFKYAGMVVGEIPSVHVVYKTVVVVVDAVPRDFSRVGPDVIGKIGMADIQTRIDDAHNDLRRPLFIVPCFRAVDINIRDARVALYNLAGVMDAP